MSASSIESSLDRLPPFDWDIIMKLLLITSLIMSFQTYSQVSAGCDIDGFDSELCGSDVNQYAGYHSHRQMDQVPAAQTFSQPSSGCSDNEYKPCGDFFNPDQISSGTSGGNQFVGYPGRRQMQKEVSTNNGGEKDDKVDYNTDLIKNDSEKLQSPQIQKHIYFHAAPPEPETRQQRLPKSPEMAQKHYTIIFIDTSSLATPARQQQYTPPTQSEEKTIVYVLVKKPEESNTNVQMPAIIAPNKPEVFFIKYKEQTKTESKVQANSMEQQEQDDEPPYPSKQDSKPKQSRSIF